MTGHAEDALGSAGISEILNLVLAVTAAKTAGTEGLITRQDGQVFDLVPTGIAAVCTVIAY